MLRSTAGCTSVVAPEQEQPGTAPQIAEEKKARVFSTTQVSGPGTSSALPVMLEVNVYELIRNAILLASIENDAIDGAIVTMGIHYSAIWPVSRELVTAILPNAIRNAMYFAKSFIHISARVEHDDLPMAVRHSCLVIEINDDGQDYLNANNAETRSPDDFLATHTELVSTRTGGVLNGPVLEIRVPFDYQTATLSRIGLAHTPSQRS